MMHFANTTSLYGRKHVAHVDMAPPIMGSIVAVSYREKDLLQELGGHKFTGNHSRSTDYIHGMESQFSTGSRIWDAYSTYAPELEIRDFTWDLGNYP